jgi:hypothetical protein
MSKQKPKSDNAYTKKLEADLKAARKKVRELKKYIQEQEDNFHLRMFEHIEAITHDYSLLLNPYPVKIKTSDKGNTGVFEFKITDVICVVSDERPKLIYLRKKAVDIKGVKPAAEIVIVNRNEFKIEGLQREIDGRGMHLVQVERGLLVNAMYYKHEPGKLELLLKDKPRPDITSFNIGKDYMQTYIQKRKDLAEIVSLHKMFVRYISATRGN